MSAGDAAVGTGPAANGGQEFLYRAGGSMLLRQRQHDPQSAGGGAEAAQDREPQSDGTAGCARDNIQLRVEGMKCAKMCGTYAAAVLGAVPGVEAVDVHFDSKIATVRVGTDPPPGLLQALVTAVRYSDPSPCNNSLAVIPLGTTSLNLQVQGMMCMSGCGEAVRSTLQRFEGVAAIEIFLAEQRVRVLLENEDKRNRVPDSEAGSCCGGTGESTESEAVAPSIRARQQLERPAIDPALVRRMCDALQVLGFEASDLSQGNHAANHTADIGQETKGEKDSGIVRSLYTAQSLLHNTKSETAAALPQDAKADMVDYGPGTPMLMTRYYVLTTGARNAVPNTAAKSDFDVAATAVSAVQGFRSLQQGEGWHADGSATSRAFLMVRVAHTTSAGVVIAALVQCGFAAAAPSLATELALNMQWKDTVTRGQLVHIVNTAFESFGCIQTVTIDTGDRLSTLDALRRSAAGYSATAPAKASNIDPDDESLLVKQVVLLITIKPGMEVPLWHIVAEKISAVASQLSLPRVHVGLFGTQVLTVERENNDHSVSNAAVIAMLERHEHVCQVLRLEEAGGNSLLRVQCVMSAPRLLQLLQAESGTWRVVDANCGENAVDEGDVTGQIEILVKGMACIRNCALKLQKALARSPSILNACVSFRHGVAIITPSSNATDHLADWLGIVREAGFGGSILSPGGESTALEANSKPATQKLPVAQTKPEVASSLSSAAPVTADALEASLSGANTVVQSARKESITDLASPSVARLSIEGMTCAMCVAPVENSLKGLDGVLASTVNVNLATEEATLKFDAAELTTEELVNAVEAVGYGAELIDVSQIGQSSASDSEQGVSWSSALLSIEGMTCSACVKPVQTALSNAVGVNVPSVSVNLATEEATVQFDGRLTSSSDLVSAVEAVGYGAEIVEVRGPNASEPDAVGSNAQLSGAERLKRKQERTRRSLRHQVIVALVFTVPLFFISMIFPAFHAIKMQLMKEITPGFTIGSLLMWILATPVQFGSGARFYIGARKSCRSGALGMDVLVALGTSAAYLYSVVSVFLGIHEGKTNHGAHFFETAAMLIAFVILGKYLEAVAKGKTSEAVTKLVNMQPKTAVLLVIGADGTVKLEKEVLVDQLVNGDIVKVIRGARVPADGVVVHGNASLDEAMITGESLPVPRSTGDPVLGATVCVDGTCHVRVTGVGPEMMLNQIARLVEEAQLSKAPIQEVAERIAQRFVPLVLVVAVLTLVVWLIACYSGAVPSDWRDGRSRFVFSFMFSIAVLVIACPCALGLATPTAVMVGTGVGAENGVLIKGGEPLERAHALDTIVFDKTGTLTVGKPSVQKCVVLDDGEPDLNIAAQKRLKQGSAGVREADLWWLIGSAELDSEHPLGKCITEHALQLGKPRDDELPIVPPLVQPQQFQAEAGKGLTCTVAGRTVLIGTSTWMLESGVNAAQVKHATVQARQIQTLGQTAVYVAVGGCMAAIVGIADSPKDDARETVRALKASGLDVWMITGDNRLTANAVAAQLEIEPTCVLAEVLPSGKSTKVEELQAQGRVVAMVGDGINDSPALACADVGMAIGAGTDIAIETASMVLVNSKLRDVRTAIDISRVVFKRIQLNFVWALGYNVLMIPFAAGAFFPLTHVALPPMYAGMAMGLSSVSVVLSSLLLRRYKPPHLRSTAGCC